MKKTLLIALMAFVGAGAYAQGTISLGTLGASVFPTTITSASGAPVGAGFMAAIYYAPVGTTDDSMFMQVGAPTGFIGSTGLILGVARTAPVPTDGGRGNFQIRAWETAFGATYEEAFGSGETGKSAIIESATGATLVVPAPPPASLVAAANAAGLPLGFQLSVVPEPSVIALGLLGAGALLVLRRRK